MSTAVIDDPLPVTDILDSESEVRKLQELVKKLQLQNQLLRRQSQPSDGDVENCQSVDANCNTNPGVNDTDILCGAVKGGSSCAGVLREQQLNSTNSRLNSKADECRLDSTGRTHIVQSDDVGEICKPSSKPPIAEKPSNLHAPAVTDKSAQRLSPPVVTEKPSLDTVGLIDLDGISLDEEDSWLYNSPATHGGAAVAAAAKFAVTPHDWLRQDFDQPSPELMSARRSLVSKLDEVTRLSQMDLSKKLVQKFELKKAATAAGRLSAADGDYLDHGDVTEIISVQPTGKNNHNSNNNSSGRLLATLSSRAGNSSVSSIGANIGLPAGEVAGKRSLASSTIVRRASTSDQPTSGGLLSFASDHRSSRRSEDLDIDTSQAEFGPQVLGRSLSGASQAVGLGLGEVDIHSKRKLSPAAAPESTLKRTSASEENILSSTYKLNDVMDVKQLAKMQEESLRMSYNAPLVLAKKGLSKSLNRSSGELAIDDDIDNQNPFGLTSGLNRSSGSILQSTPVSNQPRDSRLDSSARHTSRSAGNLLNSQIDKVGNGTSLQQQPMPATNGVYTSRLTGVGTAATGLRTPRSGLRTASRLQTPGARSTSLHGPRYTEAGSRLAAFAVKPPTNSLPSSPHSSDQDLDQNYCNESEPMAAQPTGLRQSLPNLTRSSKLSLPLTSHASDLELGSSRRSEQQQQQPTSRLAGPASSRLAGPQSKLSMPTRSSITAGRQPVLSGTRGTMTSTQHPPSPTRNGVSAAMTATARHPASPTRGSATAAASRHPVSPTRNSAPSYQRASPSPVPARSNATSRNSIGSRQHPPSPTRPGGVATQQRQQVSPTRAVPAGQNRALPMGQSRSAVEPASKTNNAAPRQQSRLITPSKLRVPSPSARRNLVSAATGSDDSWKDGCF